MTGEYFGFLLGGRRHAIPAHQVREVIYLPFPQPSEEVPDFHLGVFNLRGRTLPILDLAFLLNLPGHSARIEDVLVHVKLKNGEEWGFVADEAGDAFSFDEPEIPPAESGDQDPSRFVIGVAWQEGRVFHVLDLDRIAGLPVIARGPGRFETMFGALAEPVEAALKERARMHADSRTDASRNTESFATFYLGSQYFALPLHAIRQFTPCPPIHPVPGAPKGLIGLVHLHGQAYLVADLRNVLGMPSTAAGPGAFLLLVEDHGTELALFADALGDILEADPADLRARPADDRAGLFEGEWVREGGLVTLINLGQLLNHPDFSP